MVIDVESIGDLDVFAFREGPASLDTSVVGCWPEPSCLNQIGDLGIEVVLLAEVLGELKLT